MGADTNIEWTDATWNPVRGCSRVSQGCVNCYAEKVAARFSGPGLPYEGLARMKPSTLHVVDDLELGERRLGKPAEARWTGEVRMVPEHLADPLRWKRPRRVFVNSMSDLFHEKLSNEDIAAVFGVMAAAPQHTFQVLTKRAERMREWLAWIVGLRGPDRTTAPCDGVMGCMMQAARRGLVAEMTAANQRRLPPWPLSNVWLGVSVEDQANADERIPLLLQTPAAVRFVSYEPALGPVDFRPWVGVKVGHARYRPTATTELGGVTGIDWVIVGGESGPGARPFDVAWARSVISQCTAAGVACFVKQLGAAPLWPLIRPMPDPLKLRDKKGGDTSEWPEDLRVREFPRSGP